MSGLSVTVKRELPEQFFRDVMVTMVESGGTCIHYWGVVTRIARDPETKDVTFFRIRERESHQEDESAYAASITPVTIKMGIQSILGGVKLNQHLMAYLTRAVLEADAGDIDSDLADVIAQVILFGEVVYG